MLESIGATKLCEHIKARPGHAIVFLKCDGTKREADVFDIFGMGARLIRCNGKVGEICEDPFCGHFQRNAPCGDESDEESDIVLNVFLRKVVEHPVDTLHCFTELLSKLDPEDLEMQQVVVRARNDWRGGNVLHLLCQSRRYDLFPHVVFCRELLKKVDAASRNPICFAIEVGSADSFQCLHNMVEVFGLGAILDNTGSGGDTIVHFAVMHGCPEVLPVLASPTIVHLNVCLLVISVYA